MFPLTLYLTNAIAPGPAPPLPVVGEPGAHLSQMPARIQVQPGGRDDFTQSVTCHCVKKKDTEKETPLSFRCAQLNRFCPRLLWFVRAEGIVSDVVVPESGSDSDDCG